MTSAPIVPLRYLAKLDPGKSEVKHFPDDLEVDFIPMEAVGHGGLLHPVETRRLGDVRDGYTYLKSGDVCFAKISPSFQNRKGGRAEGLTNHLAFATTELTVLRPEPTADARFLQFVVASEPFIQHGAATLHGVAGQQRVDLSRIAAYPVWLPRVEVQRRIADMLDTETARIDTLIERNERVLELLSQRATALITAAVTGSVEVGQVEDPRTPRRGGLMIPLGYIAHVEMGQSPPSDAVGDFGDYPTPFLQGNAEFGALNPVPEKSSASAPKHAAPGSILVSVRAPVGEMNVADALYGIGRGLCAVTPDSGRCNARYLWWALQAFTWRLHAVSTGSTFAAVSVEDVRALKLPVPPLDTQRRIADMLDAAIERTDTLKSKVNRQQELLRLRRQALITAAVTGQIEV